MEEELRTPPPPKADAETQTECDEETEEANE